MKIFRHLTVCEHCDRVYARVELARHEVARCANCGATLYRARALGLEGNLALTLAAAICFVLANATPVIRISLQGSHNEATLWESFASLAHGATAPIAVPALLAAIIVPGLQIALMGWVLGCAALGRRAPGFAAALRGLHALRPWSMVEVCLLGALVTIIKLSGYLSVIPGTGLWALAALTVLITLIGQRDTHWLWTLGDELAARRAGAKP
ncbi:MAG: paraquat-inducible protein A [Candidatus Dactylopiibacterium sp.]|nr:paraquat-inducible protein A [Candidatus Dactylopiibacterium sp.]